MGRSPELERTATVKTKLNQLMMVMLLIGTLLAAGAAQAAPAPGRTAAPAGSSHADALLPGDTTRAPAAFHQDTPQMARGGNGFLLVWEDTRTNYNNTLEGAAPQGGYESGTQLKDIYAARLDAAGQLMDPTPIVVAQAPWSQTRPQVAWNGQNWLVVWNTRAGGRHHDHDRRAGGARLAARGGAGQPGHRPRTGDPPLTSSGPSWPATAPTGWWPG